MSKYFVYYKSFTEDGELGGEGRISIDIDKGITDMETISRIEEYLIASNEEIYNCVVVNWQKFEEV